MTAATLDAIAPTPSTTAKLGPVATVLLHLFPGAACVSVYLALAPAAMTLGWPPLLTSCLCALAVMAPLELGHLLLIGRRQTGRWGLRGAVDLPAPMKAWKFVAIVAAALVATIVIYAMSQPLDLWFHRQIMPYLPSWYDYGNLASYRHLAPRVLAATLVARFVADVVVVAGVEELYFRGYLLSRIPAPGWLAPFVSAALFAIYHFWQPYNWPSIFCFTLPMIWAVAWFKDVRLSIATHILLNFIGFLTFAAAVLHR